MNATKPKIKKITVPPGLHARLKIKAARQGMKLEEVTRLAIEAGLKAKVQEDAE